MCAILFFPTSHCFKYADLSSGFLNSCATYIVMDVTFIYWIFCWLTIQCILILWPYQQDYSRHFQREDGLQWSMLSRGGDLSGWKRQQTTDTGEADFQAGRRMTRAEPGMGSQPRKGKCHLSLGTKGKAHRFLEEESCCEMAGRLAA